MSPPIWSPTGGPTQRTGSAGSVGLSTPQGSVNPKNAPGAAGAATAAASLNTGAQGVSASRTATGAESSFTTTTVTFPKSARPTTVIVTVSASAVQVNVPTLGAYVVAGVATLNTDPLVLDVSMLPEATSIGIQTQAAAAQVIVMVANYA
jgi:hypothetical protein